MLEARRARHLKDTAQESTCRESADVCPPRDAPTKLWGDQRRCAAEDLPKQPEAQVKERGQLEENWHKEHRQQDNDSRARIPKEIRSQHSRDGTRCADSRHGRVVIGDEMR